MKTKDKEMCMELCIHAADISNPIKPLSCVDEWTARLFEEFFNQVNLLNLNFETNKKIILYYLIIQGS